MLVPRRSRPSPRRGPLAGFRVVEMAHHLSAPLASMYLGDFGADVVKVETLEGDDWRRWGRPSPAGMSQIFLAVNRNKRSVALDIATSEGRRVLDRLLAAADVFITNYAPEVLVAVDLDPRRLCRRYPRLVAASLTAFGSAGPGARRRAFDIVVCGEMGLMVPHPDGHSAPLIPSAPVADTAGALMLAYGIALALLHRERSGRGQALETSLAGIPIALMAHRFIWLDGEPAPEMAPPPTVLYRAYATADGFVTVAALAERLWRRLAKALSLDALLSDPRYTPWSNLIARQAELVDMLEARFRTRSTVDWLGKLSEAGVPAGRVDWGAGVFEHPQLKANGVVRTARHPLAGRMRTMGFPLKLGATPARVVREAPVLGADTARVLAEVGYRASEIERLRAKGVVATAAPRRSR